MRAMSSDMRAALTSTLVRPALFAAITFANETVYLWNGRGTLTWNGHDWQGVGTLGGVSAIEEGSTLQARGITLTMSGIDTELFADILQQMSLGKPVALYLGFFDGGSPPALIVDPIPIWVGRTDQPTIDVTGNAIPLSLSCENKLIEMNTPVDRRYTHDDQQIDNPGDLGFQFVSSIQDMTTYWGQTPNSTNNQ